METIIIRGVVDRTEYRVYVAALSALLDFGMVMHLFASLGPINHLYTPRKATKSII